MQHIAIFIKLFFNFSSLPVCALLTHSLTLKFSVYFLSAHSLLLILYTIFFFIFVMNVHISHSHTVQCTYMYNMHNVWSGVPRFLQQFGWCARLRLTSPEDMSTFCRILVDFSSSSFSAFHFLWLPQLIADNAALSLVAYAPVTATRSPTYPVTNFDAVPATPIASLHSAFQQFHFTSFYFYWSIRCFFLAHCVLVAILMRYTAEQQRLLYVCISVVLCRSERNSRRANTIGHYLLYVSSYSAATRDDCTDISSCGYEIHLPNNDALWTVQHSFSVSFFFFLVFALSSICIGSQTAGESFGTLIN